MKNSQIITRKNLSVIYGEVCNDWKLKIADLLVNQTDDKEIEVSNDLVKDAYKAANNDQKKLLEKYFEVNIEHKLFTKIKTYGDVCEALGEDMLNESDFKFLPKERRKKACSQARLQQIETLFNGDWKADWKNSSQYKYYPYFNSAGHGGLVFADAHSYYSGSFDAQAAFYKDRETAEYCGKIFIKEYENLM